LGDDAKCVKILSACPTFTKEKGGGIHLICAQGARIEGRKDGRKEGRMEGRFNLHRPQPEAAAPSPSLFISFNGTPFYCLI